jgi:DNA-directed RNA polymerase subunit E'/Rpb7
VYQLYVIRDVVRVPPKEFGADLNEAVLKIAQQDFEGIVDEELWGPA